MLIRLLGPVQVVIGDRAVPVGGPQRQLVLAVLAAGAGTAVPVETLIEQVWDGRPPGRARAALYAHVSRLRTVLAPTAVPIRATGNGYLLDVDPSAVDACRFQALLAADSPEEEPGPRVKRLDEALGLWHGTALDGLPGRWAAETRERWARRREEAVRTRTELGRHDDAPTPAPGPAQLPGDQPHFVARDRELAALDAIVAAGFVALIVGTGGAGKTALAVRWAHRHRHHFPDGQLYVDLRGYGPDAARTPGDALAGLLTALGVPAAEVPASLDQRSAHLRSRLAGRRILMLLDNAADAAQVRPLLPGTPLCAVLVTSRDTLAPLVAVQGAERLALGPLPVDDAVAVLRRVVGARVDAEPVAAVTLTRQCAQLPLALRVAGELALSRPSATLSELVSELADGAHRLDLLDGDGDERAAVRTVLSWSYRHLGGPQARTFRLLGLHPGPHADEWAAAALTAADPATARAELRALVRAHLLWEVAPGRFAMHDLLRTYAVELVVASERIEALGRMYHYYEAASDAAVRVHHPVESRALEAADPPVVAVPAFEDDTSARAWLDAERATLVAVALSGAGEGWTTHPVRLALTLFPYLDTGYFVESVAVLEHAAQVGGDRPDVGDAAKVALRLGATFGRLARHPEALAELDRSSRLFLAAGDPAGHVRALLNLGSLQGKIAAHRAAAVGTLVRAIDQVLTAGDRALAARGLVNLGSIETQLGHLGDAVTHLRYGLELARQAGYRDTEAATLTTLGTALSRQGDHTGAAKHHREALAIFTELDNRYGRTAAGNGLGESAGPAAALGHHRTALELATAIGARDEQSRAHAGLARAHHRLGDVAAAREHGELAELMYRELGMSEADQVREFLSGLA